MADPTPSERDVQMAEALARQLVLPHASACGGISGLPCVCIRANRVEDIAVLIARVRGEAREEDCKAQCLGCRLESPLYSENGRLWHALRESHRYSSDNFCGAHAIRALAQPAPQGEK